MLTWYFCIISFVMITVIVLHGTFVLLVLSRWQWFVWKQVLLVQVSFLLVVRTFIAWYFCLYDFHSVYFFITHSYYSYTSQPFIWQRHLALIVFLWWFWGSVNLNFHTYYLNSSLRVGKNLVSQTEGLTCSSSIKKVEQQSMTKNYHAVSPLSCD